MQCFFSIEVLKVLLIFRLGKWPALLLNTYFPTSAVLLVVGNLLFLVVKSKN